jgi:DNA polymerase-3 subunit beta
MEFTMKLHCHRQSLAAALQTVGGAVPTRTPKEILKNVKLQVADGRATLIGTDQEVGIRHEIPGIETDSSGEALLATNRVASIVRELQDDSVDIEATGDAVWIRAGHSEFRLAAEDPSEFPPVPSFDEKRYYMISASGFREAIRRTIFATDVESTRYALGGVLIEPGSGTLTLAATDSRRLAVQKVPAQAQGVDEAEGAKPVIPHKAMLLVERCLSDGDEDVLLAVHANDALIKCGNATIYCRLVEGRFPKYQDVIPTKSKVAIDMVAGPFYSAVRQAQIVTSEESRGVDFTFGKGLLALKSEAAEIGQSRVELPIGYDGDELTITFDPRFIADFLRVLEPEKQVRLELIDPESAAVLRTDDDYVYVIMPLSRER